MNKTLGAFLIVLLVTCGEVFGRSLDHRNFYDVGENEYKVIQADTGNVEYDIVIASDGVLKEDVGDFENAKILDQPIKTKLRNNEKGLCVGSVMLMAMCF